MLYRTALSRVSQTNFSGTVPLVARDAAGSQHPFLSSRTMQADSEQNTLGLVFQVPLSSTCWSMAFAARISGRGSLIQITVRTPVVPPTGPEQFRFPRRTHNPAAELSYSVPIGPAYHCGKMDLTGSARPPLQHALGSRLDLPHQSHTVTLENLQELDVKKDRPDRLLRILPHLRLPSLVLKGKFTIDCDCSESIDGPRTAAS
ncbi:hypothetical protein C8Q74DRAFT_1224112 [Fomes fomentarius]|nr:hypothetical protein C8Q74DRAFT_1224112 [Fomes fomentarius]